MLTKSLTIFALTCLVATAAAADPRRDYDRHDQDRREEPFWVDRPEIVLFDRPGFQGKARHWNDAVKDLSDKHFNDRAQSVRVHGRWRICTDENGGGRCLDVVRDIPDLRAVGMAGQVSSFSYIGRIAEPPPILPPPQVGPEVLQGTTVGLFLRPQWRGELLPSRVDAANAFCRDAGYREALYADYSAPVVRDLVCRR